MIRTVSIHVTNEQPLLCDLFELPSPSDVGLLCTNVRGTDGKRPVFIDAIGATFFFPYHVIRFIEIPEGALAGHRPGGNLDAMLRGSGHRDADDDLENVVPGGSLVPITLGSPDGSGGDDPDGELEIDEDFLQRIRDI